MKLFHQKISFRVIGIVMIILSGMMHSQEGLRQQPKIWLPIDSTSDYLCYYGGWNNEMIQRAMDFDLVILEPSNITLEQASALKKGHDGTAGTSDDVILIGYVSIGEAKSATVVGNGKGPCYWSWDSSKVIYENKGLASFYLDDANHDGKPDMNGSWGSYYVNAGDSTWYEYIRGGNDGMDNILLIKKLDGLFLDTIDSATPYVSWPYRWTVVGMSKLIEKIRNTYPDKYLIANRGLFYFDSADVSIRTAYENTIRPYVNAVMFESYSREGSRLQWAGKLNHEARKADGFKIIALDYYDSTQTDLIQKQMREVFAFNWTDYITSMALDSIRYDVFHRHIADKNPPTWDKMIGAAIGQTTDSTITLRWGKLTDQSYPLKFKLYYSTQLPFNFSTAVLLDPVLPVYDPASKTFTFQVKGLNSNTRYSFVIRAVDALGNEDKNSVVATGTTSNNSSVPIQIDGFFDDWQRIMKLDTLGQPVENIADVAAADAAGDLSDVWVTNDQNALFMSYSTAVPFTSAYYYHIYIDTDQSRATGYRYEDSSSIGAEYMIENSSMWKYTGTGGTNWGWAAVSGMIKRDNSNRTEISIPLASLGITGFPTTIRVHYQTNLSTAPYTKVDLAPDQFSRDFYVYTIQSPSAVGRVSGLIPVSSMLKQNYPNPFNPRTVIEYSVLHSGPVQLKIYNALGKEVETLVDRIQEPGSYRVIFPARRDDLSSGVYLCSLSSEGRCHTKKMILIR